MDQPLLQLRGITKRFTAVTALSGVDFSVRAGEVHALLGENGAGKSTLIKVLTGVYTPDEGTATLAGAPIRPTSPKEAEAAGISTVYQEVNLISALSVAENIALGRQPGRFGFVNWRAVRRHAREALARLEIACDVDAELGSLSVALQQMVAIARALDLRARLLVLDEPTASLDEKEVAELFAVMRKVTASVEADGHEGGVGDEPLADPVVRPLLAEEQLVGRFVHQDGESHVNRSHGHETGDAN